MSTLHVVSSSPFSSSTLDLALSLASKDDAILLIENGVYGASVVSSNQLRMAAAAAGLRFYVLQEDLAARAVFSTLTEFTAVSYAGFVDLVCQHNNSVSWS